MSRAQESLQHSTDFPRRSALLSRILLRREHLMPRVRSFVPREISPEEQAALSALAARGQWDRDADDRAKVPGEILELARRAARAFKRTRAKPAVRVERVYGEAKKTGAA